MWMKTSSIRGLFGNASMITEAIVYARVMFNSSGGPTSVIFFTSVATNTIPFTLSEIFVRPTARTWLGTSSSPVTLTSCTFYSCSSAMSLVTRIVTGFEL